MMTLFKFDIMKPIFKKFNDLKEEDVNFNFHIHTNQTDGESTPEEIIEKAIGLNLEAIAFTEHVKKDSDWFDGFVAKIDNLKNNKKIKVFLGIETRALDYNGTLGATQNMINKSDIVVGSVHRYPDSNGEPISLLDIEKLGQVKSAEIEFKLAMGLLGNKEIDVLGHPFGVYSKSFGELPLKYLELLLVKSLDNKIAVEINTKYMGRSDVFLNTLKKIDPYVSIGSDAHSKDELVRGFDLIKLFIEKHGRF